MQLFLGLDIGTSGVKAILIDERGRLRGTSTAPLPLATPKPGWAEQDPADWWAGTLKATKAALRNGGIRGSKVAAIGLSGQMHSSVFLDGAGDVIRPALLWCDGRTTEQCQEITEAAGGEKNLRAWASNPALEGFTLPKVLWLRKHEPRAFKRLAKVVLAKDYIRYRLTGELASEPSDASATLMYDTAKMTWSEPLLKAVGLDLSIVPDVGGSSEVLGKVTAAVAKATGLVEGTPVVGGGADNACGAAGVGLVTQGDAVASWGTSGTVLAPMAKPKVDPRLRAHTFCHVVPNTWYVMGVMLTAGGAFAWHRDQLAQDLNRKRDANVLLNEEAATIKPGADGITFLPYLQGERTPHRDASARGAFVGLTLAHSRAHLTRAVLEGICFGMRDSVSIIQKLVPSVSSLLLTGGGAASPFIRKMQADVYGLPVATVNREEGPAFGAALLAAVGAGAYKNLAAACAATLKRKAPRQPSAKAHAAYEEPYQRFRALYPVLKRW